MGSSRPSVTEPVGRLSFAKKLVNSASFIQKQCLGQECPSLRQLSLRAVLLSIALGSWFQLCMPFSLRNHLPPLETLWQPCLLAFRSSEAVSIGAALFDWFVSFCFALFLTSTTPFMISEAMDTKQLFRIHKHQGDPLLQWLEHHGDENITIKAESIIQSQRTQAQHGFLRTVAKSVNYSFFPSGENNPVGKTTL